MSPVRTATSLPLPLPLDIDLEGRLELALCQGQFDDFEALLMAVLPPWLDASGAAKLAAARWRADARPWSSGEIAKALAYAAASTTGVGSVVDAVAAALPHTEDTTEHERLRGLLVEGLVVQAWLDPRAEGAHAAMLAACSTPRCATDEDHLHLAAASFAYTVAGLGQDARSLVRSRGLSLIDKRSADNQDQLRAAWRAYWRLIGSAAIEAQDRPATSRKGTDGPAAGLRIAAAAAARGAAVALENWRDEALHTLHGVAPPEVVAALDSIEGWGPTIRRSLGLVRDQIEAVAYDPRCRSATMLAIRRDLVLWTALTGDAAAARIAAYMCAAAAIDGPGSSTARVNAIGQQLAFLRIAATAGPLAHLPSDDAMAPPRYTTLAGEGAVRLVGETVDRLATAVAKAAAATPTSGAVTLETIWSRAKAIPDTARHSGRAEVTEVAEANKTQQVDALVVIPRLAAGRAGSSRDIDHDWRPLVGRALPLVPVPDLQRARDAILARAPHCAEIVDRILADLAGRRTIRLRPTLLVGSAGCGKSTLARLLLESLGLPHIVYPAAGIADASLVGTSRQWSTGRASVALQQVRSSGKANPGIIVDEIDKAAAHPTNGRVEDGLLPLLEPATACRAFDYLLDTEVDLSAVSWIATANTVEGLSTPVRDRLRVLRVPDPEPRHLMALLPTIIADILRERGLRPEWIEPLASDEVDLIARTWDPRSLRRLAKVVRIVLHNRDELAWRH